MPIGHVNTGDIVLPSNFGDAVAALRAGELVVFPTETFYGIGADPMQPSALDRIFEVKGRQPDKPIALIAADIVSALALAREIPNGVRLLAEAFWPGPLTLVLPAREELNPALIGPAGGIAVRVSSHPIARQLARTLGGLITATSANLSGEPAARMLAQARQSLGARIRVYLDGGALRGDAPSTVVAFDKDGSPAILRAGVIDRSAIVAAFGRRK